MSIERKYKFYRKLSLFVLFNLLVDIFYPTVSYALTGGPSQPEVQSFEPIGTTDMVDLFTGDFTYNIPLFELPGPNGGYPFNLSYHSGITMDQESSWTGLGWNLNPGVINRQMRGLPDDFDGDEIIKIEDIRENVTFGMSANADVELFGGDLGLGANAGFGLGIYYNNYKGVGYNLSPSVSFHHNAKSGLTSGLSLGFTLDSQEGVGFSPSASVGYKSGSESSQFNVGGSYSSRRGLGDVFMGISSSNTKNWQNKNGKNRSISASRGGTSSLGFASSAYTPAVSQQMEGRNLSVSYKIGGDIWGAFLSVGASGYFNTQYLKDAGKKTYKKGYGYLNMQKAISGGVTDFNREKDGLVRKQMPYLAMPNLTYDIYSVAGQGTGGMYRPFRHDIGAIHDQEIKSKIVGGAFGLEGGGGSAVHVGVNASVNYSETKSGKWVNGDNNENPLAKTYEFASEIENGLFKPYSFKRYGEHTSKNVDHLDYIVGEEPIAIKLNGNKALSQFVDKQGNDATVPRNNAPIPIAGKKEARTAANLSIADYKNSDIKTGLLPLFNIEQQGIGDDFDLGKTDITRSEDHHTGGFIATNPNGLRYVYGLPAYNKKQEEYQFSVEEGEANKAKMTVPSSYSSGTNYKVDNTDKYFSKTAIPEYAHSYLLTSIVGPDYIDADGTPGPSKGDLGYWVKFNYGKATSQYNWRVPFKEATYSPGSGGSSVDDKGSFLYGQKELWYLKSAETKTHISIFELSARNDGKGASGVVNDNGALQAGANGNQYKIDKISLFTREEYNTGTPKPIKEVHFEYTYDLCQGVYNNDNLPAVDADGISIVNNGGKLTLKKVYFTYGNSTRGRLSPYEFDYNESQNGTAYNPNYNMYNVDRWGNYRPGSPADNVRFPYVNQPTNIAEETNLDIETSAWHLRNIKLPSGGDISIDYESDSYAHVQDKEAMQMMRIVGLNTSGTNSLPNSKTPDAHDRRVYFELQNPNEYSNSLSTADLNAKVEQQYLNGTRKLYFNLDADLRKSNEPFRDYVAGYADIQSWGVANLSGSNYTWGYVELKQGMMKKDRQFHPFNLAIMQHLRINNPDLIQIGVEFKEDQSLSDAQKADKVKSLVSMTATIRTVFQGFYNYAYDKGWGKTIHNSSSFIRLKSPTQHKYGGGNRVKSIVLNDGWNTMTASAEKSSEYGQVYTYETERGISSGVAAYEPMIGGDEIPHRLPTEYPDATHLKTNNNLYFEGPFNEQFFPAPQVGYSSVTVKSLALHNLQEGNLPDNIGTTGSSVNEFYTAKDYPVITKATQLRKATDGKGTMNTSSLFIPLPLLGQITEHNLTASQGYVIKLNDMHGKPKKVANYKHDNEGNRADEISSVKYVYHDKESVINGKIVTELNNIVNVIQRDDYAANVTITPKMVGVDYDFFTDMRETETISIDGGVNVNVEILITPFPVPAVVPWPNVGESTDRVRLAVTNKVIHKSGILKQVIANNEGSKLVTENVYYDELTGKPVLTTVNNNYDKKVYNYTLPAHWEYEGMGPAYENIGMTFTVPNSYSINAGKIYIPKADLSAAIRSKLKAGDEFIASALAAGTAPLKIIYGGEDIDSGSDNLLFWTEDKTTSSTLTSGADFLLTRSGARNNLETDMTTITALADPTTNRTVENCDYEAEYFEEASTGRWELNPCIEDALKRGINDLLAVDEMKTYPQFTVSGGVSGKWFEWDNISGKGTVMSYSDNTPFEIWQYQDTRQYSLSVQGHECHSNSCGTNTDGVRQFGLFRDLSENFFRIFTGQYVLSSGRDFYEYRYYGTKCILPSDREEACQGGQAGRTLIFENLNGVQINLNDINNVERFYVDYFSSDYAGGANTGGLRAVLNMKIGNQITSIVNSNISTARVNWKKVNLDLPLLSGPETDQITTNFAKADCVLNISAQSYSDNWNQDFYDSKGNTSVLRNKTPYSNGQKGIWRGKETYAYVADRNQSTNPDLDVDGDMDAVPIFNHSAANFDECIPEWRKVNEITKYNAYGNEVENRDILGRYSAATFGHNGDNASALAQNTAYRELGFEDFESYSAGAISTQEANSSSNLQFHHHNGGSYVYGAADIIMARGNIAILDFPYDPDIAISTLGVEGHYVDNKTEGEFYSELEVGDYDWHPDDPNKSIIYFTDSPDILDNAFWDGKVNIRSNTSGYQNINYNQCVVTELKAHSGTKSIYIDGGIAINNFVQNDLILDQDKKYVVSAWISQDNENVPTYFTGITPANNNVGLIIGYINKDGKVLTSTGLITPKGPIIDGWQKIEGIFSLYEGEYKILLALKTVSGVNTYFDDIRIFPFDGNMESYVYNNSDNTLSDVLDNNNYATHYDYDEQGNLFLIKKETYEGMKTIQESRTHIAE